MKPRSIHIPIVVTYCDHAQVVIGEPAPSSPANPATQPESDSMPKSSDIELPTVRQREVLRHHGFKARVESAGDGDWRAIVTPIEDPWAGHDTAIHAVAESPRGAVQQAIAYATAYDEAIVELRANAILNGSANG